MILDATLSHVLFVALMSNHFMNLAWLYSPFVLLDIFISEKQSQYALYVVLLQYMWGWALLLGCRQSMYAWSKRNGYCECGADSRVTVILFSNRYHTLDLLLLQIQILYNIQD